MLIDIARPLYANDDFGIDLDQSVYALDSTTISLCLSMFPWAHFRKHKAGVKLHTLLDLRGNIPTFMRVTDALLHDVNILDDLVFEPGAFYVMDKGYLDFSRLYGINQSQSYFVTRAKKNLACKRIRSRPVDKATGLKCDQTIGLLSFYSKRDYPDKLRRIHYVDIESGQDLVFLTNCFFLDALDIARLYKCRWQVELFFKWIKQHLKIKAFYGTSANAVQTQIWIALSTYVLVAIMKKRLQLDHSLYTILQILNVTLFEKRPILQGFSHLDYTTQTTCCHKQLPLFEL